MRAVDADPQFDLTRAFGRAPSQAPATLLQVMAGETSFERAVIADVAPGVDLLAGHRDLERLELTLVSERFAAPEVIVPVSMRDSAALQSAGEVRRTVAALAERGVEVHISAVVRTEIPMLAAFDNSVVIGTP